MNTSNIETSLHRLPNDILLSLHLISSGLLHEHTKKSNRIQFLSSTLQCFQREETKILVRPDPCVAVQIVPAMVMSLTEPWTGKDKWYSGRISFNVRRRTPLSQWICRLTWSISMIRLKCFIEINTSLHIDNDEGEWPQPITRTFQRFVVTSFRVDRRDSIDVGSTYNRGRHENVRAQFQNSAIEILIFLYWSLWVQKVATWRVLWWWWWWCKAQEMTFLFFLFLFVEDLCEWIDFLFNPICWFSRCQWREAKRLLFVLLDVWPKRMTRVFFFHVSTIHFLSENKERNN